MTSSNQLSLAKLQKYILRVVPYFDEPVGLVKIQTTSKSTQRYYTTKRLIRDLLSNTKIVMSVRANFADIYQQGMRYRSMRSRTELAREIQLTDWSTAGEQVKLVFVISTKPSLAQFISFFTTGKNRLSIVQITHQFKFFALRFLSKKP